MAARDPKDPLENARIVCKWFLDIVHFSILCGVLRYTANATHNYIFNILFAIGILATAIMAGLPSINGLSEFIISRRKHDRIDGDFSRFEFSFMIVWTGIITTAWTFTIAVVIANIVDILSKRGE